MAAPGIDGLQNGLWAPPGAPFCGQTSAGLTGLRSYFLRLPCPRSMSITKMAFFVATAAAANDNCDVGIYAVNAGAFSLLGSSGSTAGLLNSTGLKQASLLAPVSLVAGQIYYAAFASGTPGGAVATLQTTLPHPNLNTMFGPSPPQMEQTFNNANFPLAAAPAAAGPITSCPILALLQ
jgi:hypothetical protein